MTRSGRTALAASWLLSSAAHAQGADVSVFDAITRDAQRYADCWNTSDQSCHFDMSDRQLIGDSAILGSAFSDQTNDIRRVSEHDFYSIEVARPWQPFVSGNRLVSFVPYFETIAGDSQGWLDPQGWRYEVKAYLIAISYDAGDSWRFIKIRGTDLVPVELVDGLIPGAAERPLPAVLELRFDEPELARSRSLRTSERKFVAVENGFVYAMKWQVRPDFDGALDLTIIYDDPADRRQPLRSHGSLEPRQLELEWQSPVLTAFERGEFYEIVVEGRDPDSGELIFEHRQYLLFEPTREIWRAEMAQLPVSNTDGESGP